MQRQLRLRLSSKLLQEFQHSKQIASSIALHTSHGAYVIVKDVAGFGQSTWNAAFELASLLSGASGCGLPLERNAFGDMLDVIQFIIDLEGLFGREISDEDARLPLVEALIGNDPITAKQLMTQIVKPNSEDKLILIDEIVKYQIARIQRGEEYSGLGQPLPPAYRP